MWHYYEDDTSDLSSLFLACDAQPGEDLEVEPDEADMIWWDHLIDHAADHAEA